jgi:hypothetical protein
MNESVRQNPEEEFERSKFRMKQAVRSGDMNKAQRLRGSMAASAAGTEFKLFGTKSKLNLSSPSEEENKFASSEELKGRLGTGVQLKKKIVESIKRKLNKKLFESNKPPFPMVEPVTYETDEVDPNLLTRKPETYWDTSDPDLNMTFGGRPEAFNELANWLGELIWGSIGVSDLTPAQLEYFFNNFPNWYQQMIDFVLNIPIGGIGWIQTPNDGWFAVSHDGENGWTILSYHTSWPGFLGHPFDVSTRGNVLMNPLWLYLYTVNGIRR